MVNKAGERWWVRKESEQVLVDRLFAGKNKYIGPNGTLSVVYTARGDRGVLEAEDPFVRNYSPLAVYYEHWRSQLPFSGEPFFEWLDYGS